VLAAVDAVGGDLALAGLALADLGGLAGRGARFWVEAGAGESRGRALVIDEAYNANPASMRVTLAVLGEQTATRRIAMLGEMRELGEKSDEYHTALAGPVRDAGVQLVILVGEKMKPLAEALEGQVEIVHVPDAAAARDRLTATLEAGDAVLIKGSNGVGLSAVVAALASGKL
jgi:UDP-N-acetylmuramoyl-tripeptide--D-alanyl-D-alanine ligase